MSRFGVILTSFLLGTAVVLVIGLGSIHSPLLAFLTAVAYLVLAVGAALIIEDWLEGRKWRGLR